MLRHQRCFEGKTKYQFPGGLYTPLTTFDKLEERGDSFLEQDQLFYECM